MMILTVTLLISLAVFADTTGSPKRLPNQVYKPEGPASTSGRKFEELTNTRYEQCHYDAKGIFYEENGKYYLVRRGIPLIEYQGLIIGRYLDGLVAPVYNSERKNVLAYPTDFKLQFVLNEEDFQEAQKSRIGRPMPPDSRIVNLLVPQESGVKVLPHDREVNSQYFAPSEKFGKSGKRSSK